MNIDPEKYGKINQGSSRSIRSADEMNGSSLDNINVKRDTDIDSALLDSIEKWYSRALDTVGLNFKDPIQAYGTFFNKNMQTLGLDPQRPGNSYVFFTRPDLNFNSFDRGMTPFFDYIMKSQIGQYVAEYLQYPNVENSSVNLKPEYKTDSPFDPIKTNLCKEVSGLKDIVLDSFETSGDFMGHQLSYATGADGYDSVGEVTVTFEDTFRSPIFLNHYLHIQYIHEVARGAYWPKYKYLVKRIIDYTISIYLFKLAEDNQTILRWAKLTGCYPVSIPLNTLNHSRDLKQDEFDEVSVTYKYNFYEPMDPRVLQDFNKLTHPMVIDNMRTRGLFEGDVSDEDYANLSLIQPQHYNEMNPKNPYPENVLGNMEDISNVDGKRTYSVWSRSPYILGNKLLFV